MIAVAETIYTIPINEAFENAIDGDSYDCPFCLLKAMLERNELALFAYLCKATQVFLVV